MTINCSGEELILSKERAIYWAAKYMLIISDLHLGKSAHFRKSGIQVPNMVGYTDLKRLNSLMKEYSPRILLVTGDMFHNRINSDIKDFATWRRAHESLKVILIKGNHDELSAEDYGMLGIEVYEKELICGPFRFIHDKPSKIDGHYNISGHIHPGVMLYGKAKQSLKFPCFYFGKHSAVLPAFSLFTGLKILNPEDGERFYAITPERVVQV